LPLLLNPLFVGKRPAVLQTQADSGGGYRAARRSLLAGDAAVESNTGPQNVLIFLGRRIPT